MMIRPYDLERPGSEESFPEALRHLATAFLQEAEVQCGGFLDAHEVYLAEVDAESVRSRGEYFLDLLTFGLLRLEYAALAQATPDAFVEALDCLWKLRAEAPDQKLQIDKQRGKYFLDLLHRPKVGPAEDKRLVTWLAATGEFVQEAFRMRLWLEVVKKASGVETEFQSMTCELATWFLPNAKTSLGFWTSGAGSFRSEVQAWAEAREDLLLITRSEGLYHLNMVGAEIMNRAFRPGFVARAQKVVLLPGCMRIKVDDDCQARRDGMEISCTHCHPSCEVAAIDGLGREHGFRVCVVPHASSFTAWLKHWQRDADTALVASACPLHLLPGGYEMRALGLEAQCVLLNYSGCRAHWDPAGTPTRLDRSSLLDRVLEGCVKADCRSMSASSYAKVLKGGS